MIDTHFEDGDEIYVNINIIVDTAKTVKPIQVKSAESANKATGSAIVGGDQKYKTLVKYTFYESGTKYIKVLLDFPDAKKLISKDHIQTSFDVRSFEVLIHDYKGENFKFAVPKLHCKICPPDCSIGFKSNNVVINLRKKKEEDNWWSLFKQKAVGEKDGDSSD